MGVHAESQNMWNIAAPGDYKSLSNIFDNYIQFSQPTWPEHVIKLHQVCSSRAQYNIQEGEIKILRSQNINSYDIYKKQTSLKQLSDLMNNEVTFCTGKIGGLQ